jgi:dephospho-CoA kinase
VRVGLTGGIGSGKSVVARLLVERGAVLVDSDALAREVVEPGTPGLAAVVAEFGDGVLTPDGSLDRDRLGEIVFGDDAARARLNAIVHPLVGAAAARLLATLPPGSVVVHDVPLLVEVGMQDAFDLVVVVAAEEETQLRRLVEQRGMSEDAARARIAAQLPLVDKIAVADVVIRNDGSLADLEEQVDELWKRLAAG